MGLSDEALQVLADKDAFMTGVVTGSHEFRLSKIDAKDEQLTKTFRSMMESGVDRARIDFCLKASDIKVLVGDEQQAERTATWYALAWSLLAHAHGLPSSPRQL